MNSLFRQLRSEWARGRGRPVEKYAGAVVIVLGAMMPIVMIVISSRNSLMQKSALESLAFPESFRAARTVAALLGPFWAAVLGANIVGAEYQYVTWPWLLVRSSSRLRLVVIKLVSVALRIVALTFVGIGTFVVVGAGAATLMGAPLTGESMTLSQMAIPFVGVTGAMAFAASIGFTITIVTRSVAFGTLTGALALPLFSAIRFKETAAWIPYVHLDNLQTRLLTGQASPFLKQAYDFQMSGRASVGILAIELLVVLGIALAVFRKQEIVY
jgi:ABC-type transport system involved in multi-copper enzyme maturation permease subunit